MLKLKKNEKTPKEHKKLLHNKKKEHEPQYYTSATNNPAYNYNVYRMSVPEKVAYFALAFLCGGALGYLFYGGLGCNQFGQPTQLTYILDAVICLVCGMVSGILFLPIRTEQIIRKRKGILKMQFRDMLESLSTSLGSGKNVPDSFKNVYDDLKLQYEEGEFILNELKIILDGYTSNVNIEDVLDDFGRRSGCEDIISFANVFRICYRKGGNIKDTIRNTHSILSDKMEVADQIETVVTSSKFELNILMVMPIVLIGIIKASSPDFAQNFTTVSGVIATTVSIILFVIAYFVGRHMLNIKV